MRGNVDYLTLTETKKNLRHVKKKNKIKINVAMNKSNQSTIHLFIECNVTFSHK